MKINFGHIELLISDVDGVLTDGAIYVGNDGIELKKFNVLDGAGVAIAKAANLKIALISGRYSLATECRAKELGILDVYNGLLNKIQAYDELKSKYSLDDANIAYIGDDLIDLPVMEKVALPIATANAVNEVKKASKYVTTNPGGKGAFREAVSLIIEKQGRKDVVYNIMKEKISKD